jgi:hypothetical protein
MGVAFGEGELRHGNILSEELSCLRWLDPANGQSATSGTTWTILLDMPEKTSFRHVCLKVDASDTQQLAHTTPGFPKVTAR